MRQTGACAPRVGYAQPFLPLLCGSPIAPYSLDREVRTALPFLRKVQNLCFAPWGAHPLFRPRTGIPPGGRNPFDTGSIQVYPILQRGGSWGLIFRAFRVPFRISRATGRDGSPKPSRSPPTVRPGRHKPPPWATARVQNPRRTQNGGRRRIRRCLRLLRRPRFPGHRVILKGRLAAGPMLHHTN